MKKLKERKKGKIISVLLIALFVMSTGTLCFANSTPGDYYLNQYEYGEGANTVSDFIIKDTYSSMFAYCTQASNLFTIYAVGSTVGTGHQDDYIDASYGYYYVIYGGEYIDDMINSVRESGCCNAGVKGVYQGDSAFAASGWFLADK